MPRYATKVKRVKRGTRGKRTRRNVRGKKKTVIRRPRKYMRGGCDKCSDDNCSGCNGMSTNFRFSTAASAPPATAPATAPAAPKRDPDILNPNSYSEYDDFMKSNGLDPFGSNGVPTK